MGGGLLSTACLLLSYSFIRLSEGTNAVGGGRRAMNLNMRLANGLSCALHLRLCQLQSELRGQLAAALAEGCEAAG